jgi:hypothetical protein
MRSRSEVQEGSARPKTDANADRRQEAGEGTRSEETSAQDAEEIGLGLCRLADPISSVRTLRGRARTDQAIFPRAVFAAYHRHSISCTACFMSGRYLRAANSGVIDVEKKIRFKLPSTGPAPRIGSAMALMPASDPPTEEA